MLAVAVHRFVRHLSRGLTKVNLAEGMTLFKKLIGLLDERDARDIVVIGGGIIPEDDIPLLKELGVAQVFTPGATTTEIVAWVRDNVQDSSAVEA